MLTAVKMMSDRSADEVQFGGLSSHAIQPTSSLSLVSSGYGTAASSEKSRWSHAEVSTPLTACTFTLLSFSALHVIHRFSR